MSLVFYAQSATDKNTCNKQALEASQPTVKNQEMSYTCPQCETYLITLPGGGNVSTGEREKKKGGGGVNYRKDHWSSQKLPPLVVIDLQSDAQSSQPVSSP